MENGFVKESFNNRSQNVTVLSDDRYFNEFTISKKNNSFK